MGTGNGGATNGDAGQSVKCRDADRAGGGLRGVAHVRQASFGHRCLPCCTSIAVDRGDRWCAIGAPIDGDGQLRSIGEAAVAVGIGKAVTQALAGLEFVDCRVGVVERVGVAAVGCNHQCAVATGEHGAAIDCAGRAAAAFSAGADGTHRQSGALRVAVRRGARGADTGQHVAAYACVVFGDLVCVIDCQWHVVLRGDVDRDNGITIQTAPAALDAGLVVIIKSIAQSDCAAWGIRAIGIVDRTNDGIDLRAGSTRAEGDDELPGAVGRNVGHGRAAVGDDGGCQCHLRVGFDAKYVFGVGAETSCAVAAGDRQSCATKVIFRAADDFYVGNVNIGIEHNWRTQYAAISCTVLAFDKRVDRGRDQVFYGWRIVDGGDNNRDRIGVVGNSRIRSHQRGVEQHSCLSRTNPCRPGGAASTISIIQCSDS